MKNAGFVTKIRVFLPRTA